MDKQFKQQHLYSTIFKLLPEYYLRKMVLFLLHLYSTIFKLLLLKSLEDLDDEQNLYSTIFKLLL